MFNCRGIVTITGLDRAASACWVTIEGDELGGWWIPVAPPNTDVSSLVDV